MTVDNGIASGADPWAHLRRFTPARIAPKPPVVQRDTIGFVLDNYGSPGGLGQSVSSEDLEKVRPYVALVLADLLDHEHEEAAILDRGQNLLQQLVAQALDVLGQRCGLIGTLGTGFYGELQSGRLTTPDPIAVQSTLYDLKKGGAKHSPTEESWTDKLKSFFS